MAGTYSQRLLHIAFSTKGRTLQMAAGRRGFGLGSRTVKSRPSKSVHETYPKLAAFSWQEGYSVFSVSKSQEEAVKAYIAKQAKHHSQEDFKSEHLRLLRAHGVAFDER
jgi:REP element-mobilizing transposase RayT